MATELYIIPTLTGFKCADQNDEEAKGKLNFGQEYKAILSQPRNIKYHRKYFAFLKLVFLNLPEGRTWTTGTGQTVQIRSIDDLRWHISIQMGHYDIRYTLGGKITYQVKSISFAAMSQPEFEEHFSKALDTALKYFIDCTDMDKDVMKKKFIEMIISDFG